MNARVMEWLRLEEAANWLQPPAAAPFVRVLIADLRDPRMLFLLRPAPVASDYRDEARPGASDRGYFLARRAALRSLVGLQAGCSGEDVMIGYDAPGAPRVKEPEGFFVSVSGRGSLAALAVANVPVGIDIETCGAKVEIIEDVLHDDERKQLSTRLADEKRDKFLRIWTAKEAYLKALGTGLNVDPATVAVSVSGDVVAGILHDGKAIALTGRLSVSWFDGVKVIAACVSLQGAH